MWAEIEVCIWRSQHQTFSTQRVLYDFILMYTIASIRQWLVFLMLDAYKADPVYALA
ncbi:hypothetical protein KI387_016600, partial [Taxus chinensis]